MLSEAALLPTSAEREESARVKTCELSLAQEQIWLDDQITPGTSVYNVPLAVHIEGPLNEDAWEQSLDEIVRRHEVLRATFSSSDRPVMTVRSDVTVSLTK